MIRMNPTFSFTGEKLEAQRGSRTEPSQPHGRAQAVAPRGLLHTVRFRTTSEHRRRTGRWPGRPRKEKPGGSLAGLGCRKALRTHLFLRLGTFHRSPCPSRCTAGTLLWGLEARGCPQGREAEVSDRDLPWPQAATLVSLAAALGEMNSSGAQRQMSRGSP